MTEGTRGEIKRAVAAYGKRKYEEGYNAGVESEASRREHKTLTEAVAVAYQEGRDKAETEYENLIEQIQKEKDALTERVKELEAKIAQEHQALMTGSYFSHNPHMNIYAERERE